MKGREWFSNAHAPSYYFSSVFLSFIVRISEVAGG